jgi:hypothetical protein
MNKPGIMAASLFWLGLFSQVDAGIPVTLIEKVNGVSTTKACGSLQDLDISSTGVKVTVDSTCLQPGGSVPTTLATTSTTTSSTSTSTSTTTTTVASTNCVDPITNLRYTGTPFCVIESKTIKGHRIDPGTVDVWKATYDGLYKGVSIAVGGAKSLVISYAPGDIKGDSSPQKSLACYSFGAGEVVLKLGPPTLRGDSGRCEMPVGAVYYVNISTETSGDQYYFVVQ